MKYQRIQACSSLATAIEYFWTVTGDDPRPVRQKIIPDGCPELIFHFGAPFRIQVESHWLEQSPYLLAGQLTGPLWLENTGQQQILGIKFKPSILSRWFSLNMAQFTNRVVNLERIASPGLQLLKQHVVGEPEMKAKIDCAEKFMLQEWGSWRPGFVEEAIATIHHFQGGISIAAVCKTISVGERRLERAFMQHVGFSPKQYSRVVRFRYLFDWIEAGHPSWVQIGLRAGYYDQSHFIREFKTFAGEEPSGYSFAPDRLGNFLVQRISERPSDLYNTN